MNEVTEALTETVGELRRVAMRDEAAVRMLAEALDMLAGMHRMARRLEVALPLAEERLTITRSLLAANPGPDQRRWCARALNQLGRTLDLLKRHHEALLAFREAVAWREKPRMPVCQLSGSLPTICRSYQGA